MEPESALVRARKRGPKCTFTLARLLEALLLSRLLSSADSLPQVLVRAMAFVLGSEEAESLDSEKAHKLLSHKQNRVGEYGSPRVW